jgi:hypothetical protein
MVFYKLRSGIKKQVTEPVPEQHQNDADPFLPVVALT